MKSKKLFILALASAFGWSASAFGDSSSSSLERFQIGLKIAPSISWLSSDNEYASGDGSALKFNWGAVVKYNLTTNYAIVTGFNVNGLGGYLKYERNGTRFSSENSFRAFEIPVAFRLTTEPLLGDCSFFAQLGLGLNYTFNPEVKATFSTSNESTPLPSISNTKSMNRFVFAYNLAVGAEYQFRDNLAFTAHILYNNSLSSLLNSDKYHVNGDPINGRYNFVELGIGVLFQ